MIRNRGTWIEFGFEKNSFMLQRGSMHKDLKRREKEERKKKEKKLMAGDTLEVHRVDMLS